MPRSLDRFGQTPDGPRFRVLSRDWRWLVWREGGDHVEFVGDDWYEMRGYLDERFAIEGPGEVLCFGSAMRVPGESRAPSPS